MTHGEWKQEIEDVLGDSGGPWSIRSSWVMRDVAGCTVERSGRAGQFWLITLPLTAFGSKQERRRELLRAFTTA